MRLHYSASFQCDLCGAVATVDEPQDLRKVVELPKPDGWVVDQLTMSGSKGPRTRQPDVCRDCAQLPFGEVVERLRAS